MENPGFISEMIAALSRELKARPLEANAAAAQPVPQAAPQPPHGETFLRMIRPTTRQRVAIDLHRQEWP